MQVLVIDGGPGGPVVATLNADDSITVVRELEQDQPQHGQVSLTVDDECWHIVFADFDQGLWTIERHGVRQRVRFTGRHVCLRCLRHHGEDCG